MQAVTYQLLEAVGFALVTVCWLGLACFAVAQAAQLVIRSPHVEYRLSAGLLALVFLGFAASLCVATTTGGTLEQQLFGVAEAAVASAETTPEFGHSGDQAIRATVNHQDAPVWARGSIGIVSAVMVLAGAAYVFGFAVLLLKLALQVGAAGAIVRRAKDCASSRVQGALRAACKAAGLASPPRLAVSDQVRQPVVLGLRSPVILLPSAFLRQLGEDEIHNVLLHEAVHIKRGDLYIQFVQRLLEAILYFHPVVWLLSSRMTDRREYCCDAEVVKRCGRPVRYAQSLLQAFEVGKKSLASGGTPHFASGLFGGPVSQLKGRVAFVLSEKYRRVTRWSVVRSCTAMAGVPACLAVACFASEMRPIPVSEFQVFANRLGDVAQPTQEIVLPSPTPIPDLAAFYRKYPDLAESLKSNANSKRRTISEFEAMVRAAPGPLLPRRVSSNNPP
ncbi:MAG: hypothetical protein Aurels2KO_03860 [Aureliella sp.]